MGLIQNEKEHHRQHQPPQPQPPKLVVGYALTSKKVQSFLQPKLERLARKKGILFIAIDPNKPLSDQGPFNVVLHKLSGKEWCKVLEHSVAGAICSKTANYLHWSLYGIFLCIQTNIGMLFYAPQVYRKQHPEVTVLDPPDAVRHVHNRQSMLEDVAALSLSNCYGKVGVPKQLVILRDASSIPDAVIRAELKLPLVAKPLVSDGSVKSHQLSLAYNQYALSKLEPPLVLQEFVNHGGVLFKVFIVGDAIKVVRRFSLPDVNKCEPPNDAGVYKFPRVSSATSSADEADLDPGIAEHPPKPLLEMLAKELHQRLGLQLFNIDIIREHGTKDKYYVIDINYFPGYGKMPGYEHIFTDFLLSLVQTKYTKQKHLDK